MLQELHIRNFALIDSADLEFGPGLNLLTGETGAGKSILIDALGLALGDRGQGADMIRTGADRAQIEAVFDLSDAPEGVRALLREAGFDDSTEDTVIVSRELARFGKSQCRINGRLMPVSVLRDLCEPLVDVHGQHEHQSLMSPDKHIDMLDNWLGASALGLRNAVADAYSRLTSLRRELDLLRAQSRERARNLDLFRYQLEEISAAGLKPDEESDLDAQRLRLAGAEKLSAALTEAYEALKQGAEDGLNTAAAAVDRVASLDDALQPITEQLNAALSYAEEARTAIRQYRDGIDFSEHRMGEVDERLHLIHNLKRKYGATVEEVIGYGDKLATDLDRMEIDEAAEGELSRAIDSADNEVGNYAGKLSSVRKLGGADFAAGIMRELNDLGMAATRFDVRIDDSALSNTGCDRVEFMLSPNPGEALRPLAKIASGGEASRIMLAMKSVLAQSAGVPTLVFDEIDVGIGGRTAAVVAEKLASLARGTQILCITHLPQIASCSASVHLQIEKTVVDGRTTVAVRRLAAGERVEEIARMLGGKGEAATVLQHAREMLGVGRE